METVDEQKACELAEEYRMPFVEIETAFAGESVERARGVLDWIEYEEWRLREAHGVIEGRKRYRPLRMLKSWARKYGAGRYASHPGTAGASARALWEDNRK